MRVPVPHSDSYPLVTLVLFTPQGEVSTTVDDSHFWVDISLPEGVQEDEVDVYSCFLGPDHRPPFGCGLALLKAATRKPASEPTPAPAVEPALAVEPRPAAPVQAPEPAAEPEPAPVSEPAPAVEPEDVVTDEPGPAESELEAD